MSHCPTKDIHSIYLDNEMPEIYKAEYEAHLAECPECQKQLNLLKALHTAFNQESSEITPDKHYLDQSFERLQTKMKYRKNTGAAKNEESKSFKYIKYIVPAAAAAAVFAFVIPVRVNTTKSAKVQETTVASAPLINPLNTATNVSLGGGNGRVISGNIHETVLPYATMAKPRNNRGMNMDVNKGGFSENGFADKGFNNNAFEHKVFDNVNFEKSLMKDVEVFGPAFSEDKTISIKITIPGMLGDSPFTTEVSIPTDVTAGQE